jgi:6-phosphogluconolactonase (cycloisomerase 2 family)
MKNLYLAAGCFTATLLAACGGGTSVSPSTQALQQSPLAKQQTRASTCPCLYVASEAIDSKGINSVTAYPVDAKGNAKPIEAISGSGTQLDTPAGIALDTDGNMYVTNFSGYSVTVYAAGANGNAAPIRTITSQFTSTLNLVQPVGIALDAYGNVYVANSGISTVAVFAAGANGNVAPIRTISGSNTNLNDPTGIALDASGNIYVASAVNKSIDVYAAGANGNVTPVRVISGTATQLLDPVAIVLNGSNIYVSNFGSGTNAFNGSVTAYAADANGNVAPTQTISNPKAHLIWPEGIALDAGGNIHVANNASTNFRYGYVNVYAAGANGHVKPTSKLKGKKTKLSFPTGVAIR